MISPVYSRFKAEISIFLRVFSLSPWWRFWEAEGTITSESFATPQVRSGRSQMGARWVCWAVWAFLVLAACGAKALALPEN
jgi:hypothetical protein